MSMSAKLDHYPGSPYMPAVSPATMATLNDDDNKYIATTKIMVLALSLLFAVVSFVICLHIYAKWKWSTSPARGNRSWFFVWPNWSHNRSSASDEFVLDVDALDINMVVGLGKAAVDALPKFKYKMTETGALECAICLEVFMEDEIGRTLPKCSHSFHLQCIDMWLYSHSSCPLCRTVLEPEDDDSINLETSSIHVFRMERASTPRRLHGMERDQAESEQPIQIEQEQDTGSKRADSIPANVLFWGNLMQQVSADSRLTTTLNNNNSPQAPPHVTIDISMATPRDQHGAQELHNKLTNTETTSSHVSARLTPYPEIASEALGIRIPS